MAKFTQPPLSLDQQIENLILKGLVIDNPEEAKNTLSFISYFRLKLYQKHFIGDDNRFSPGTDFNSLINLYSFDRDLKLIIFHAIENIEVAIKTLINNQMCERYGSHWFLDHNNFRTLQAVNDAPLNDTEAYVKFSHENFIADLKETCRVGSQHNFISNYMSAYNDPALPPSWMVFEIITFGTISKIYEYLNDVEVRDNVAGVFNLTKKMLTSWLHCITNIRNICAHHSKLVYTTLIIQPVFPTRSKKKFLIESDLVVTRRVYSILCCIQHLLSTINTDSIYKQNLLDLIDKNPQINYTLLGFTPNWRDEPLWS